MNLTVVHYRIYSLRSCIIQVLLLSTLWSANEGHIEVGKLWIGPSVTNYGYMGNFEYPGGSKDYYVLEQSNVFSCVIGADTLVLYGGTLGNELDYGWQNADTYFDPWTKLGNGTSQIHLSANSNFNNYADGDLPLELTTNIWAFNHPDYEDFVIIEHSFTNTGTEPILDFYYGSHLPVDVGASGISYKDLDDYGEFDSNSGFTYMFDDNGDGGLTPYLCGQVLLGVDTGSGIDTTTRWNNAQFYQMVNPISGEKDMLKKLTGGIMNSTMNPGPWSILNAVGPYTLLPGSTLCFSMAVVYGEGLTDAIVNVQMAKELAQMSYSIPSSKVPPPVPLLGEINVSSRVIELRWEGSASTVNDYSNYNLYRSSVSAVGPWGFLTATTDTQYVDIGRSGFPLYYSITSVDQSGNESGQWGRANRTLEAVRPVGKAVKNLGKVIVVPNPYLGGADWETNDYEDRIYFTQLPDPCTIYIYTLSGNLVKKLPHSGSGWESWDLLSNNKQTIASGLYLFRVVTPGKAETTGKFVIIKGSQ